MSSIWGPDVEKFNPERWFSEKTINSITNCNYLPFLTGSRGCIGNKVAFNEMKVFLTVLIRNFEFHEVEGLEIKKKMNLTLRPDPSMLLWVKEIEN
jgi:cytochrome P450